MTILSIDDGGFVISGGKSVSNIGVEQAISGQVVIKNAKVSLEIKDEE